MGKLGKKARKFAKKNLQSVLRRKRKTNALFKKKASKRKDPGDIEEQEEDTRVLSNVRRGKGKDLEHFSLDAVYTDDDDDDDATVDDSDSDGYLSEDLSLHVAQSDGDNYLKDNSGGSALSSQNKEMYLELVKKTKKLDRLKKKDSKFSELLESYAKELESFRNKEAHADDDESIDGTELVNGESESNNESQLLTSSDVNSWCQLVTEQQSLSALTSLLNGYRSACHYRAESSGVLSADLRHRFQNSEAFCKIWIFMLNEGNNLFRKLLGLSESNIRKDKLSELKNTSKWNTVKPLIKSYLRSTLYLLNQVSETEILTFSLAQVRASMPFFFAFPSLLRRLVMSAVHFWAAGGGSVSSYAFLIIQDLASMYTSDWFDTCFVKTYKSFIGRCHFVEPVQLKHIQFLRNSFVELCTVDVQKSSRKAMVSIQQLAKILHQGLQTKKKEAVKNICNWQYISCIDLWVMFISANVRDFDLQPLLYMIIQIINGLTLLFRGPRYLPLRVKCIQWLNHLSSSSGIFIPVASLILDVLEYKIGEGGKHGKVVSLSTGIKLPKHFLKSRNYQEHCILSAIELLSAHFAQWSYHISFPELATISLIRLRKFHETTTIESFKRVVKRFIDQVEQNIVYVQKKRDEVAFSPKDQQSVELFLLLEKQSGNAPFTQYYKSIMTRAVTRNLASNEKFPGAEKLYKKIKKLPGSMKNVNGGQPEERTGSD
ncbi:Nucleolar complex protein [Parasponia andersonii]|uniref:Nucleolar complex protein n=1 Tax=Parasponia andersonii TaxID=3476 RepID=A0A2P5CBY1_PARAD|nr:Nucleolar complex protein [Parasponia andersonii]